MKVNMISQTEDLDKLYDIRDYTQTDKSFVLATFLRGLYYGNEFYNLIPKHIFMENYKHFIDRLITNPKVIVKVACLKEDQDVILGYSILSSDFRTIHWVYVKSSETKIKGQSEKLTWRGKGIGKSLIPQFPAYYTHFTTLGIELAKKYPYCVFNPFEV